MVTMAEGIAFGEGPRWHDGALWWSDMHGHEVCRLAPDGTVESVCEVPNRPSGLGWMPDGRMLVVSMVDKRVLRRDADGTLAVHADLSGLAPRRTNDMVVDRTGRAYVGNFGFEIGTDGENEDPRGTVLIAVEPDGSARVVADDLWFPNGMVIADGGKTLVVAETWAARLTAFDIAADGGLSNRRVWAQFDSTIYPDGICRDAEGAIWVASPATREVIRVQQGGAITDRIATGHRAFACALNDREPTLYVCLAGSHDPERQRRSRDGRIEAYDVAVPAAR